MRYLTTWLQSNIPNIVSLSIRCEEVGPEPDPNATLRRDRAQTSFERPGRARILRDTKSSAREVNVSETQSLSFSKLAGNRRRVACRQLQNSMRVSTSRWHDGKAR